MPAGELKWQESRLVRPCCKPIRLRTEEDRVSNLALNTRRIPGELLVFGPDWKVEDARF